MKVKKLLASLLAMVMIFGMMSFPAFAEGASEEAQVPWDGTAVTEVTPDADGNYNISNGAELAWIAQQVNSGETDKIKIVLQNDIDLNGQEWTPIGGKNVFSGTFDGNGHAVKNLKASRCDNPGYEDRSIGLIGNAIGVSVKNLKIENCEITGRYGVGAVVGEAEGPILFENIEVLGGTITADKDTPDKIAQVAGGILGIGYGAGSAYDGTIVFRNCVNYSNVTVNKWHAGGLWGSITYANNADVTVEGCHNYGSITSLSQGDGGYAGGLGGYFAAKTLTITDCINHGTVTADKYQGELVAYSTLKGGSIPSESVAARIDSTYYETLQDAVEAAQAGDTITLLNDVELTETYTITNTNAMTIDFGGHYIDVTEVNYDADSLCIAEGADVTFTGKGGIRGFKNCLTNYGGVITLNGGAYTTTMIGRGSALYNDTGTLNINSGVSVDAWKFALYNETGAVCNLNGGTIVSHAHNGLEPETPGLTGFAYAVINAGTMNVYDGVTVKGIQGAFSASGNGVTNVYGGSFLAHEDDENTAGKSFYACYAANNADLTIWDGTFTAARRAAVYVGNEDVGLDGAMVKIKGGTFTSNGGAAAAAIQTAIVGDLSISGGTFSSDVSVYVESEYYQKANEDGTFVVLPSLATVIDTAKTTGAEVTLDGLHTNDAIEHIADATYKVVLSTAPQADVEAANEAIAAEENSGSEKAIFDISVIKTDSNGTTTDISGTVTNQQVTLTLGETPKADTVRVYHVTGGAAEKVAGVTVSGNKVTFIAPSFSTYAVSYDAEAVTEEAVTSKVGVVFSPVTEGGNQYYITLKAMDSDKVINRFMSADLVFKNNGTGIGYEIEPAANMTASTASVNENSTEYHFEMNGTVASSATGEAITIGTITFNGYGTLDFSVDTDYVSGHAINIVNTAKVSDNIVDHYMVNKESIDDSTLVVNGENGTITGELNPATKNLTVHVAFPNEIVDNAAEYQAMTLTVSGGDLKEAITVNLGEGREDFAFDTVELNGKIYNAYSIEVNDKLTQNTMYTVTIEGKGYRTVRYSVNMQEDKELTFWNNVMDKDTVIEKDNVKSTATVTFLAGDIVKDNNINIYDLSAVVSYFGEDNLVQDHPEYAKYDLNRDGKIDSKDVAMVLVSWGN